MTSTAVILPETYYQSSFFRSNDVYLPHMDRDKLIADFFPPTFTDVVQILSNTTSAFYGLMLVEAGKLLGLAAIDDLSKATLYALGKRTAQQIQNRKPDIEKNARGISIISIAAIYAASPEYNFDMIRFEPQRVEAIIAGTDRYHKIAKQLGIDSHVTSPIAAFMQGINDGLALNYTIHVGVEKLDEQSNCAYRLTIRL